MLEKLFSRRQKEEPAPEKLDSRFRMVSEEDMRRYQPKKKSPSAFGGSDTCNTSSRSEKLCTRSC